MLESNRHRAAAPSSLQEILEAELASQAKLLKRLRVEIEAACQAEDNAFRNRDNAIAENEQLRTAARQVQDALLNGSLRGLDDTSKEAVVAVLQQAFGALGIFSQTPAEPGPPNPVQSPLPSLERLRELSRWVQRGFEDSNHLVGVSMRSRITHHAEAHASERAKWADVMTLIAHATAR